jgi:rhodanese-related sulfurtransferase
MAELRKVAWIVLFGAAVGAILSIPGESRSDGSAGTFPDLSPAQAQELIGKHAGAGNFVLLDVRTPKEFAQERIRGAVEIDFHSRTFREQVAGLDRGKTYLVYCRTGNRSGNTVKVMKEEGFGSVYHLSGGIVKWKEAGLPTVK